MLLVIYSLNCRVQIGARLFLPVIPLLTIGVAAAIVQTYQQMAAGWVRGLILAAVVCACGWTAISSVMVWPHALCYGNEIGGGPRRSHLNLGDSNHDWGQGLPELLAWKQAHPDAELCVWYFGTDPQMKTAPLTPINLGELPPGAAREQLKGRYLAVSMSHLYGGAGQCLIGERLRHNDPDEQTTTFLIYDFRRPDAVTRLIGD
jgi:hypothetical protein